jgi:CRISPR system Cascade subunit CasB
MGVGFGAALAESGFAEPRLERLLAADGPTLRVLVLRAVRFLASRGSPFDWTQLARLLLTRDPSKREQVNRQIAKDFYQGTGKE